MFNSVYLYNNNKQKHYIMTTQENTRFNEVNNKLNLLFKKADENGRDNLVKNMKIWLKSNPKTDDKAKKEAIQSFLEDINIF